MSNLPVSLTKKQTLELLKIGMQKEDALSREQWELLGCLVGSLLIQIRQQFVEHSYAVGVQIKVEPVKELCSIEELSGEVPFFTYRM